MRRRIAAAIETVVEEARGTSPGMSSEAPTQNRIVKEAEPALRSLAEALEADGPADPRGVALAIQLLTDTTGPLYRAEDAGALTQAALDAAAAVRDSRRR